MARNKFINEEKRKKLIDSNQWLQKLLFQELPLRNPTPESQIFVLRREERDNGDVVFLPTRTTIEELINATNDCWDEGNAFSTYTADDIWDEGDAFDTLASITYDEGDAFTIVFGCCPCAETEAQTASIFIQPINNLSADADLNESYYYRTTGGSTFTVAEASGLFDASRPFSFRIKNVSGATITINRSGSDTFYTTQSGETTYDLADGESVQMVASSATTWDII